MTLAEAIKAQRERLAQRPKAVQEMRARLIEQAMRNVILAQQARKARESLEKKGKLSTQSLV